MNKVRTILEEAYKIAESKDNTDSELSETQKNWISTITQKQNPKKRFWQS